MMKKRIHLLRLYAGKLYHIWRARGFRGLVVKVRSRLDYAYQYRHYMQTHLPSPAELERQRRHVFSQNPLISIVVPLYNTPPVFLKALLESVQAQTYSRWQLCLADGSQAGYEQAADVVSQLADSRIVYSRLAQNEGISGNSNRALALAAGEYVALLDHDDLLAAHALYEVVQAINQTGADFVYSDELSFADSFKKPTNIHFKPDFAIDNLRSNNYICHLSVFRKRLLDPVGGFRSEFDGSQDYDLILRLTEAAGKVVHIPKVLYYWRVHPGSVAADISAKPYAVTAAKKALTAHLERVGLAGTVEDSSVISTYRIRYAIQGNPRVSIIIPTKDHTDDLDKCLRSILGRSTYADYEIVLVENNSEDSRTFAYYEGLKQENRIRLSVWDGPFNFSEICNFGARQATGEYLLFLNNDTEVITPDWIESMLMYAQRPDVGAVGAKLYYGDDTVQHAGVGIGLLTLAGHYFRNHARIDPGYMGRLSYAQNVSAVTAACLMMKAADFQAVGGFDPQLAVAFNDIDLCMKIRQKDLLIVFTPYAELYHYESKSRGLDSSRGKRARFVAEVELFQKRWRRELDKGDPYYNINLSLENESFAVQ